MSPESFAVVWKPSRRVVVGVSGAFDGLMVYDSWLGMAPIVGCGRGVGLVQPVDVWVFWV